jgi:hypothetical protein
MPARAPGRGRGVVNTTAPSHPNGPLAAQARQLFAAAAVGSIDRKAAGAVEVALATTRSVAAARRVLEEHHLPDDVRQAALELLDALDTGTTAA